MSKNTTKKTAKNKKKPTKIKKGLGKGISALIPRNKESLTKNTLSGKQQEQDNTSSITDSKMLNNSAAPDLAVVPVVEIEPMPGQPRTFFDTVELDELAASIREKGVLQPILVRRMDKGYQLIAGERRWKASQKAGLATIPVKIMDVDESEAYQLALIENIQREDLNPVEVARAYRKLVDEFNLTQEEVAKRVGKDRASVANYIRILTLPGIILDRVADKTLSFGHARTLVGLPREISVEIDTHKLISGHISVRELERLVKNLKDKLGRGRPNSDIRRGESPQTRFVRKQLERLLGLRVRLKDRNGKGELTIEYSNLDELEGVLQLLGLGQT